MSFSESLTVRILGDSTELQRELNTVLNRFDELKGKISETSNSAQQFSRSLSRLSQSIGPLQQVSNFISRISQQLQAVSQRPITLNVGPALASLNRLSQAAQQTAAAIRAIPPIPVAAPTAGLPFIPPGNSFPTQRLATGGLVTGPSGIDQVPAQLTAGEFVVNRTAVERLGLGFLERLNASPSIAGKNEFEAISVTPRPEPLNPTARTRNSVPSLQTRLLTNSQQTPANYRPALSSRGHTSETISNSSQTNNNFGGITIQVTNPSETEELLRDLQLRGIGQRIRRG